MPNAAIASGASESSANRTMPSAAASHSACRNSGAISARRPPPSICDTDGGKAISVPIGTVIGSQNSAVPIDTAASVSVPWWPAIALSTKPINPLDRWPSDSGSSEQRAGAQLGAETARDGRWWGHAGPDRRKCVASRDVALS